MTHVRPSILATLAALAWIVAPLHLCAQGEDDPLAPRSDFQRIGGELGLSSVWQDGFYYAGCGLFEKGARISPFIAVAYDRPVGSMFRFEALLGYRGYGVSSSYVSRDQVALTIRHPNETEAAVTDLDFEHNGTANFTSLFLMPSMKLYITKGLYVGGGANLGLIMGGTSQYTKTILSKVKDIVGVGLTEVSYPEAESSDPYTKVYDPEPIPNKSTVGIDALMYIGAEIPFGRHLRIGPRVMYQLPLTPIVTDPELKFSSLTFTVGARWDLP